MSTTLVESLRVMLVRELNTFVREIEMFPDDELMWTTVPGVTNSAANLALHVAGNLQHFIGAVLGRTGYERDRAVELGQRSGTKAEVIAGLQRAIDVVNRVLPAVSDEMLTQDFPVAVHGHTLRTD